MSSVMSPQLMAALEASELVRNIILEHLNRCLSDSLEGVYTVTLFKNIDRTTTNRALIAMLESGLIIKSRGYRVSITERGAFMITNISKLHQRLRELEQCTDEQIDAMYTEQFDLVD